MLTFQYIPIIMLRPTRDIDGFGMVAERMRDLARRVVPLLRGAGEPLSRLPAADPRRLKGGEHRHALISFLESAMHISRRYAPG